MVNTSEGIVVSTRVRLARNLEGFPFPSHLKDEKQAKEIIRLISSGLSKLSEFRLQYMDTVSDEQAVCLMENHLISPKLIKNKRYSAALINGEENVSSMINEEDHLREQCIVKGLDLKLAYETMSEIDNHISKSMKFAFDEQLGFLTACPTNLGTGLRASVMQFLPALTMNGLMPKLIRSVSRLGLTVRGMYGEGSDAEGFLYQISNEVTLGVTEDEILQQVGDVVKKVCALEESERRNLMRCDRSLDIQDECMRAYGVLTNCAKVSTTEFVKLISKVKLGACLGYVKLTDVSEIDRLMVKLRPTNINAAAQRNLTPLERDIYRARCAAATLKKLSAHGE